MSRIEANIQDDIERQGRRISLQSVICPNRVAKQAEAYFRCVGELPDGGQFTINVIQQDDQGTVSWDVPSSKVLINLVSLEETIQADIKAAVGKRFAVDCRDTYRINKRGDTFECDVVGAGIIAAGRVESVLVKVNGESNLEWQEVVIGAIPAAATPQTAGKPAAAASGSAASETETATDQPDQSTTASSSSDSATAESEEDEGDRQ